MGLLGSFKDDHGRRDEGSSVIEEMNFHICQVQSVIVQLQVAMGGFPSPIREAAQRAYIDNVGKHMDDSLRRLTKLQRKLGSGKLSGVSKQEITALKDEMMKLDDHLQSSYREVKHLPEGRKDRRLVKETVKEQSAKVKALVKALDRFTR